MFSLLLWGIGGIAIGLVVARYAHTEDGARTKEFLADEDCLKNQADACVNSLRRRLHHLQGKK